MMSHPDSRRLLRNHRIIAPVLLTDFPVLAGRFQVIKVWINAAPQV